MILQKLIYNTTDTTKQKRAYQVRKSSLFLLFALSSILAGCGGSGSDPTISASNTPPINTTPNAAPVNTWAKLDISSTGVTEIFTTALHKHNQNIYLSYTTLSNKNILSTRDGETFTEYTTPDDNFSPLRFIDEAGTFILEVRESYEHPFWGNTIGRVLYTSTDLINYTNNGGVGVLDSARGKGDIPDYINGRADLLIGTRISNLGHRSNVYKSIDGGSTWVEKLDLNGDLILNADDEVFEHGNSIKPAFNGIDTFVLLASSGGLLLSQDSGITWSNKLVVEGDFFAVTGNSLFSNSFFAANAGKIFRSDDTGNTWSEVNSPSINGQPIVEFRALELLDDGTLLSWGLANNAGQDLGQVFKSTDSGLSWAAIGNPIGLSASASTLGNGSLYLTANDNHYFLISEYKAYKLSR